MIIFGEPWDAPMCEDAATAPTPTGEPCGWCRTTIQDGDRGVLIPCVLTEGRAVVLPWHRECLMRSTAGSPAHLRGHCTTACRGDGREDDKAPATHEQMRAEALESWRMISEGGVP
jgi:hypothetical protein